jgi:hypothetical protein
MKLEIICKKIISLEEKYLKKCLNINHIGLASRGRLHQSFAGNFLCADPKSEKRH